MPVKKSHFDRLLDHCDWFSIRVDGVPSDGFRSGQDAEGSGRDLNHFDRLDQERAGQTRAIAASSVRSVNGVERRSSPGMATSAGPSGLCDSRIAGMPPPEL